MRRAWRPVLRTTELFLDNSLAIAAMSHEPRRSSDLRRPVALNVPGMVLLGCLWIATEALGGDFGGETQLMFPLRGPAILQTPVDFSFSPAVSDFREVPIRPASGVLLVRGQSPDEAEIPEQYAPAAESRRLLPFSLFDKPPQSSQETPVARPDSMSVYLKGRGSLYMGVGVQQFDFALEPVYPSAGDFKKYSGNPWMRLELGTWRRPWIGWDRRNLLFMG
jgi:hypothetical protein